MAERKRLGEILLEMEAVTEEQIHKALLHARQKKLRLGEALVDLGSTEEEKVFRALCRQFALPFVDLERSPVPRAAIDLIPPDVVREHRIIPLKKAPGAVIVAIDDPEKTYLLDDLRFQLDVDLRPALATTKGIRKALVDHWDVAPDESGATAVTSMYRTSRLISAGSAASFWGAISANCTRCPSSRANLGD